MEFDFEGNKMPEEKTEETPTFEKKGTQKSKKSIDLKTSEEELFSPEPKRRNRKIRNPSRNQGRRQERSTVADVNKSFRINSAKKESIVSNTTSNGF